MSSTPPRKPAGKDMGFEGRPANNNRRGLAMNPQAARKAKEAEKRILADKELSNNKVLINLRSGYMDPSLKPMRPRVQVVLPKGGPMPPFDPLEFNWERYMGFRPKEYARGVPNGAGGVANGNGAQYPPTLPVSREESPEYSNNSNNSELNNENPKGKKRFREATGGAIRRKTYKKRSSKKVKTRRIRKH
jgi:hypothetical protein